MKRFLSRFHKGQIIAFFIGLVSLLIYLGLRIYSGAVVHSLYDQNMAKRWSKDGGYAQISCFTNESSMLTEESIEFFRHTLTSALEQESITAPNTSARLFTDSYCGIGTVSLTGSKSSGQFQAFGVGGDFFEFHKLNFKYGSYFQDDTLMKDYVIIDEETAWQLFGSVNVAGMKATIGGVEHTIMGVITRDKSSMAKAGGLDVPTVYMPYSQLETYGSVSGISTYEIVMPNPISGYAMEKVKSNLGVQEEDVRLIENSKRYSLFQLFDVMKKAEYRSMKTDSVQCPYWENIAIAYEDKLANVLIFEVIFLLIPVILVVILLVYLWKHRKWNKEDVKNLLGKAGSGMKKLITRPIRKRLEKDK